MRRLLLGLAVAATAMAVRRSSAGDHTAERRHSGRPGEIDLTDDTTPRVGVSQPEPPTADPHASDRLGERGHRADAPTEIPRPGWRDIGKRTLAEVKADRVPMMAAAVAFAGLLALFPAMIAGISIYGLVADPATAASQAGELTAALPEGAAGLITDQLSDITSGEPQALGIALVLSVLVALWSASGGMGMLINALNVAYDEADERNFVRKRGLAIVLTLGALVFIAVTVTLIAVVPPVLDNLGLGTVGSIGAQVARWLLLALLIAVALAVLYRFGPHREDARWSWISPGAVVAGVLWLLGSLAFSFFVSNFGSYNETYGTISGVIVLMLWLQISALVVLLGAEMNAEMERQTVHDTTTGPYAPLGRRGAQPADDVPPPPDQDVTEEADEDATERGRPVARA